MENEKIWLKQVGPLKLILEKYAKAIPLEMENMILDYFLWKRSSIKHILHVMLFMVY